jgi:PEGA domain
MLARVRWTLLVVLVAWSSSGAAQTKGKVKTDAPITEAAQLKADADAAFDAKHYQEALALYDRSLALAPLASIYYNRGRVFQYLGQYPRSLAELERFAGEATPELKAKVPAFDAILDDVRRHVATVRVQCSVSGAHVLIGSMDVGVTPLAEVRVSAGPHQRVDVLADGYYPFRETLDLPGAETTSVDVQLASRDHHGLLLVRSALVETSVSVDGVGIGLAPSETILDAGAHGVRVTHEGYSDAATRVFLRAGEQKEITLSPLRRPSVLAQWWFWTLVSAAVIGGAAAVTTYALTTERAASPGNFSPGAVHF